MANRPRTIREIQADRSKTKSVAEMTVLNISKQLIIIHQRPPKGVDFYIGAQDVRLKPGQSFTFKKNRLWTEQVERLQKQQKVSVIVDTDKLQR